MWGRNNMGIEKLIRKELLSFGGYSAAASPEVLEGKIEVAAKDMIKIERQRKSLRLFAAGQQSFSQISAV